MEKPPDTLPLGPDDHPPWPPPQGDPGDTLPTRKSQPESGPASAPGSLIGKTIDGFRIKKRLGHGGMGDVYLAEQNLGAGTKEVALKTIRTRYLGQEDAIKRFQEEAFAAGTMKTSYVAQVMSYGQIPAGRDCPAMHYLVMEYATGGTLSDYMMSFPERRLPVAEAIRLLRQAAEGFLAAERRVDRDGKPDPLVHRDIKPANLLLQRSGATGQVEIRIADFGAVKRQGRTDTEQAGAELSQMGAPMTPGYASPEQWNYEDVDHRSDMYSLGATFYHVLTGQRATPDTEHLGLMRKFVMQMPCMSPKAVLGDVPEALNHVIEKMTARDARDRYASFAEIVADLAVFEQKPASLRKVWLAVGVAVVALTALVLLFGPRSNFKARDVLAQYEQLAALVARTLAQPELAQLEDVGKAMVDLAEGIREQQAALAQLVRAGGTDATVPADTVEMKGVLATDFNRWRGLLDASLPVLGPLASLENGYESLSKQDALEQLAALQPPPGVASLGERIASLRGRITGLYDARKQALDELLQQFRNGPPPAAEGSLREGGDANWFSSLGQRVGSFAKGEGSKEPTLGERTVQLQAAIEGAAALESGLPRWPVEGADGPQAQLQALVRVLQGIAKQPPPGNQILAAWWERRLAALAGSWQSGIREQVAAAKDACKARVEALQNLPRDEAERSLRTNVLPEFEELSRLFTSLKDAIRGAKAFSRDDEDAIRDLADPGPRPSLLFRVSDLTKGYMRSKQVAEQFVVAVGDNSDNEATKLAEAAAGAITDLQKIGESQVPEFPGHDLPYVLDSKLAICVTNHVNTLLRQFRRGELPQEDQLQRLQQFAAAWGDWNQDCIGVTAAACSKIAMAHRLAKEVDDLANHAEPVGAQDGPSAVLKTQAETFLKAVVAATRIRDAAEPDADLAAWREAWCDTRLPALERAMAEPIRRASADLQSTLQDLKPMASHLAVLDRDIARRFETVVEAALQAIARGAAPKKPDSWSAEAWRHWPQSSKVPADLQARWQDGVLVCWFTFRQKVVDLAGGEKQPVEMVLVTPSEPGGKPFLIDRHEVCVGELLALEVAPKIRDPGGYLNRRKGHWADIEKFPTALLSWTSHKMATGFAQEAYAGRQVFTLPAPEQWQVLVAGAPPLKRLEVDRAHEAIIDPKDEYRGVYDLRSGLAEWLADGGFSGASDYDRANLQTPNVDWKKGVGFRCTLTLL